MTKKIYEKVKKHTGKLIGGILLIGISAVSLDSILHTQKGSFMDPQTESKYKYSLVNKSNSRHLYVWPENCNPLFASKIRDFDSDGIVDHFGSWTYPRMPIEFNILKTRPEYVERAQRLYNLALENSQK